jgi:hypothetical protein
MTSYGATALGRGGERTRASITSTKRKEQAPASTDPIAWRCEHDHKFHPMTETSYLVYVDDMNQNVSMLGLVRARGRHVRRMVVCQPCARTLGNMEASR